MKIDKELFWPCMMLIGSALNVVGSAAAISIGAHKTKDGDINPFFFTTMTTSLIYSAANITRIVQVLHKDNSQEVDVEMGISPAIISRSTSPELPYFDERTRDMVRTSYRDRELVRQNSEIGR